MSDEPPRRRMSFLTIFIFAAVIMVMIDPRLRNATGNTVGVVLGPVFGFGGAYPVLTIMLVGAFMVAATTVLRHFTTDWLTQAQTQAEMRHFQKEFSEARKSNNTYKMKILQELQPKVMAKQQEMSKAQLRNMPITMIIVIPLFAWLFGFVAKLDYWWYTAPWNHSVDLLGSTVFPHWILLYMCLSIPLGALIQKAMKYLSWKERWKERHPEVHE